MQFYLQAAIVEKGITAREYGESRIEVTVGCVVMTIVAFFIIVACAGAIWAEQPRDIPNAAVAALALRPFGEYAYLLFCVGLFNASLFAASILPLSTSYTVCEGLGPVFYWLFTLLIVIGGGMILLPQFPLVKMILISQVINGMLLPFVLIFMILLVNRRGLMKEWVNSRIYNAIAWLAVIIMIGLTLALVGITARDVLGR
jgi:Mn2+/Fe2+ NRAMP family transporter